MKDYSFAEGEDFLVRSPERGSKRGGHNRKDYLLTRDMAKELAMIERTDVGRQTRRKVPDLGEVPINPHSWRRNIPSPSLPSPRQPQSSTNQAGDGTSMTTPTTDHSGDELRVVVEDYGNPSPDKFELTPEEQTAADEIRAMDPLAIPGPSKGLEGRRLSAPTLATLNPEMRREAEARLAAMPLDRRAAAESEVVMAVYRDHLPALRVATGLGEDATPYHRELASIAANYRAYAQEFQRIAEELAEVGGYKTVTDPETGEQKPETVWRLQGQQRTWREARLQSLNHAMNLLQREDGTLGPEGQARVRQAMKEAAQARLALKQAAEDKVEVERRAAAKVREDRIAEQVDVRTRMLRNNR